MPILDSCPELARRKMTTETVVPTLLQTDRFVGIYGWKNKQKKDTILTHREERLEYIHVIITNISACALTETPEGNGRINLLWDGNEFEMKKVNKKIEGRGSG